MTIRVLVADDQALVRAGLMALLRAAPGMTPVAEAADGAEAVALAAEHAPDVVLMDVRMPVLDGIAATERILAAAVDGSAPRVIVLTTFDVDEYVYDALRHGASGFLLKDTPPERILAAIETVVSGEVLVLVAHGLSNDEIAASLVISPETVKTHVKRTMSKLGLTSRAQAVVLAYEAGLVVAGAPPPQPER